MVIDPERESQRCASGPAIDDWLTEVVEAFIAEHKRKIDAFKKQNFHLTLGIDPEADATLAAKYEER